jgi:hypothetical protein
MEVEGKAAVQIPGMRAGRSGRFGLKLQRCEICLSLLMWDVLPLGDIGDSLQDLSKKSRPLGVDGVG